MDSEPRVSLFTARATSSLAQHTPSSSCSTGSLPIRAPLTIDDDSDFKSNGHEIDRTSNSYSSEVEFESEGFVSGEDFETASERALVADPDEEFMGGLSRAYVADPDEGSSEISMEEEELSNSNVNRVMPIAQLSMDDDGFEEALGDDGMVSEVDDDSGFSGLVKIPGIGVLRNNESALKVKVFGVEERENGTLLGRDSSVVGRTEEDAIDEKGNFNYMVYSKFDENKNHGLVQEAGIETLIESQELNEEAKEQNIEHSGVDSGGSVVLDLGSENEKQEFETNAETDPGYELSDPTFDVRVELKQDATEWNEIQMRMSEKILGNDELPKTDMISSNDSESYKWVVRPRYVLDHMVKPETDVADHHSAFTEDITQGLLSDKDVEEFIFGRSGSSMRLMNDLEQKLASSTSSGEEGSEGLLQKINGQIVVDSGEAVDTDRDEKGNELNSAALAVFLKAITKAESNGNNVVENELEHNLNEEEKNKLEKIQLLTVKFLRLVQRLGLPPDDSIAAQVLYRLGLDAGSHTSEAHSLESAKEVAMQLEADGKHDLDFSLNVLVIGKTGVGKSATINSMFGENKVSISAFEPSTTTVKEIVGEINGINIRVLDTPGLRSSLTERAINQKILASVKKYTNKFPPDVVLYVDRLDVHTRDLNDLPLLKSLTSFLSSSIWQSAIITLTHAAASSPDGPSGSPLSYEVFVSQRSHIVQQSISQAVGHMRLMKPRMMHPVALVENHSLCQKDKHGENLLPNGQSWRPQLLLLCYSLKILSEARSLSKSQDPFNPRKLLSFRIHSPPLPYLLSLLLQSHTHPNLSAEQGGDYIDSDIELGDLLDTDQEDEDEYDQLPPFKPLKKSQLVKLSKEQMKAYFEEYDYRVKLLQQKQLREDVKRLNAIKKKGKNYTNDNVYMGDEIVDPEDKSPATVLVPLPDMVLPPSFDGDNPAYRYRFLEPTSESVVRPVLEAQGWDHDCGYSGVSVERNLTIANCFPSAFAIQITKDKKDFNIHLVSSVSAKHGENQSTMGGFDIQTVGRQLAYVLRSETKFKNLKINKTAAGFDITLLGENLAAGLKIEDQIALGKRLILAGSTGAVRSRGDTTYGANFEVRLKGKDFPIGQDQSTLGLSLVKWRGDLGLMANLHSQFSIGRSSKVAVRVGLNNKQSGQVTVKVSSSEQLQTALIGIVPVVISICRNLWPGSGTKCSSY